MAVLLASSAPAVSLETVAAAKIPGLNAKVTEKNILKILDKYNKDGAYGLLNEFMAYPMFPRKQSGMIGKYLLLFVKMAYAEFKYYILHYLYYAKQHYSEIYQGIVDNRQFCISSTF